MYECGPERGAALIADILVEWLPPLLEKYGIWEIVDLGCGDLYWFSQIPFEGIYDGYDETVRASAWHRMKEEGRENWALHKADIFVDEFKPCDLCIVKDVFIHYSDEKVLKLLGRIKERSVYLLAESHFKHAWPRPTRHHKIEDGRRYTCLGNDTNLIELLGDPIEQVEILPEGSGKHGRKIMGIWVL